MQHLTPCEAGEREQHKQLERLRHLAAVFPGRPRLRPVAVIAARFGANNQHRTMPTLARRTVRSCKGLAQRTPTHSKTSTMLMASLARSRSTAAAQQRQLQWLQVDPSSPSATCPSQSDGRH